MGLRLNIIVAVSENYGIGKGGELPWKLREEMKHFARMTKSVNSPGKQNMVLMGRKTWESIPHKFRPLPGRLNGVLSSQIKEQQDSCDKVIFCQNFEDALKAAFSQSSEVETVWVIGGHSLYKMALQSEHLHRIYLTKIMKEFECDVFFPSFDINHFKLVEDPSVSSELQQEGDIQYKYEVYEKI
uniref:dihydrofolate reductase n=1 Tax=Scylla olivacea TaxID=85551 RepID=A0A0P4WIY8_SCYOL